MLLQWDDFDVTDPVIEAQSDDFIVSEPMVDSVNHHLSLNAMNGFASVGTIRFQGHINGHPVQVLIDGGSTDNFLQPRVARFLKLSIETVSNFNVLVGNGNKLVAEGKIDILKVSIQGPHVADYGALTLKFFYNGAFVTLQGQHPVSPGPAQLHHLTRLQHTQAISEVFTLCCFSLAKEENYQLDIPTDMPSDLATLLLQYSHIFEAPTSLPPKRNHDHSIPLLDESKVVKVRPYRYPHSQKEQIELMVTDMLKQGIIQPSTSPFSSPIILVKKKDGTWRFCTDYRALNSLTIKDSFPLPTVDELLDELFGAKVFSKLDLRAGYHQILMNPSDRHKTAFRTHHGHYECPSWLTHLNHLQTVLQLLSEHHLFVKLSKCSFGMQEVEYLGHVVSGNGVTMDKIKVQVVLDWPTPTNVKQLRGFLGLTGYYRRFIKSYATISAPLTDLLKKDQFQWSNSAAVSFDALKQAVTSAPVLALPNFSQPFVLETDASNIGLGAVLSQQGHPIAYFSKKLGPNVQKQSAY
ncbi:hypothetical protein A2U01_0005272, partial [Trifolium medium]|nr:hypothetical protein [Trifolium medium]